MISNLQALRAFAALNVVMFHIIGTSASYNLPSYFISKLEGWGENGVDLFFVISGFVIVYTQQQNPKSPVEFIKNRIIRILPTYWIFTLFLASALFILPMIFRDLKFDFQHLLVSLFFISNLTEYKLPLLHVGWTLEYEIIFYSIFAISLCLRNNFYSRFFTLLILCLLTSLSTYNAMILEFIMGMVLATIYSSYPLSVSYTNASRLLVLGMVLLCISIIFKFNTQIYRILVWGIPSFLLVMSLCYMPQTKNRLLILLGNASYSIYLIQVFTIPCFYKLIVKTLDHGMVNITNDLFAVACLIFTALAGISFYLTIEKPLTHLFKNLFSLTKLPPKTVPVT